MNQIGKLLPYRPNQGYHQSRQEHATVSAGQWWSWQGGLFQDSIKDSWQSTITVVVVVCCVIIIWFICHDQSSGSLCQYMGGRVILILIFVVDFVGCHHQGLYQCHQGSYIGCIRIRIRRRRRRCPLQHYQQREPCTWRWIQTAELFCCTTSRRCMRDFLDCSKIPARDFWEVDLPPKLTAQQRPRWLPSNMILLIWFLVVVSLLFIHEHHSSSS